LFRDKIDRKRVSIIKKVIFDKWSQEYDTTVCKNEFPFIGYEKIKNEIIQSCEIDHSTQILDIGVGTGNFMQEFYSRNAQCYGLDFSEKMIEIAASKMPSAYLIQHDLNNKGVPVEFERAKFSVIVSAYVFHHFRPEKRNQLIDSYLKLLKKEDGRLFLVDISFRTQREHDACREKYADEWDSTEFYLIAEELCSVFKEAEYTQFSECGGLYSWDVKTKQVE